MDPAATSHSTAPLPDSADAPYQERIDQSQSPDSLPASLVAQRRIVKTGVVGSPVHRSPHLSCLPPPQPPTECQHTSSDSESESVIDVALHLSREDTPDNDTLPPDEPSAVLASRILRANDNPSPPPLDLAHPGVNYVPGKDGQFPSHAVSAPPSPFRTINLLERLSQVSDPPFDPSRSLATPSLDDRPDILESSIHPPRGFISSESCSPFVTSVPTKCIPREDMESADTFPSLPSQYTADDLPLRSPRHVCDPANVTDHAGIIPSSQPATEPHEQLITMSNFLESEAVSSSTQVIDSSSNIVIPLASDVCSVEPLPSSGQRDCPKSAPPTLNAAALSSSPSNEAGETLLATETMVTARQDNDGEECMKNSNPSVSELQESKCTTRVDANSHHELDFLSPRSINVLSGPIEQTILSTESTRIEHPPATPPQSPKPSIMHPDFSRSTVQRPVVAPTPVQANNGSRKLISPHKISSEAVNDICRTPAQRVPIESALARGTSSFQKTIKLSTGSGHPRLGRFPTIRALVLTRPVVGDPSRSPKRVPVTTLATSPTRGEQAQRSPTRFGHRARSASVEPRPLGSILTRSRSVEPPPVIPKLDSRDGFKESIFPIVPMLSRSSTKLPFPLVPGQNPTPAPIHEESETEEMGNTEIDGTVGRVIQGTMSQLRQPSANSRIPRIGNKPYAKPPSKNGKTTIGALTAHTTRTPKALPFQLPYKNSGVGNSDIEASSVQPANDLRLVGSLKRKRDTEVAAPSNSHPVMIRQVVPGILSEKYSLKPAKISSQVQASSKSSPPKVTNPLKFRKVVDGMLSARYPPAMANFIQAELSDSTLLPSFPISELASSSNEEPSGDKLGSTPYPPARSESETSDPSRADGGAALVDPCTYDPSLSHQDTDDSNPSSRPRRTSRTRKPAQQQCVLDIFNDKASTRPPPARRKPKPRAEDDGFMGMSATALKALTTSNTTKNQQTVAVLATEVIRKEGLRPESPTVKARTILQKQRDERESRMRERAQRRTQMSEEGLGASDLEGLGDRVSFGGRTSHTENDYATSQKHRRGPGDEEDETPERPERIFIESSKPEEADRKVEAVKQVKWHRGLSTVVHLDEIDPRPKPLPKNVIVRGCLAPTSKNLPLDPLGNLVDIDNRPSPELVVEQIIVKRYLYDNDIEPEPIPTKTRSKSKRSRS